VLQVTGWDDPIVYLKLEFDSDKEFHEQQNTAKALCRLAKRL
jgi:hypothetical protein